MDLIFIRGMCLLLRLMCMLEIIQLKPKAVTLTGLILFVNFILGDSSGGYCVSTIIMLINCAITWVGEIFFPIYVRSINQGYSQSKNFIIQVNYRLVN